MTWLTPPEPAETLHDVLSPRAPARPRLDADCGAPSGVPPAPRSLRRELANAVLGCVLVYAALFGVGEMLLRSVPLGCGLLVVSALAGWAIARNL